MFKFGLLRGVSCSCKTRVAEILSSPQLHFSSHKRPFTLYTRLQHYNIRLINTHSKSPHSIVTRSKSKLYIHTYYNHGLAKTSFVFLENPHKNTVCFNSICGLMVLHHRSGIVRYLLWTTQRPWEFANIPLKKLPPNVRGKRLLRTEKMETIPIQTCTQKDL